MLHILRVVTVFLIALTTGWPQSELATISGTVVDPSGSAVTGATVTAVNESTNATSVATTSDTGRFVIANLRPGVYRITTAASGFKQFATSGVIMQVNQTTRLDISLELGAVTEVVNVSAQAGLLETDTSSRGSVIDTQKILELPLNGRDYNQLAALSTGVALASPRLQSIEFKGVFNVNGNRAFQNAFLLDGVDNTSYSNSFRGGNTQIVQPSIDALQEFKIQTNAYSAEFGRSSGALVNAVTRSGSNQFHGSLYEFHRNKSLDAANFFSNKAGQDKPARLRNQFGGTFGGPVLHDRTFFFGDYEGLRDRRGNVRTTSVPLPIWRGGMFTIPIYNPYNPADTGQDFRRPATPECNDGKGNCWIIPSDLIDPVGQKVVNVNPDPNAGGPSATDANYVSIPVTRNRTDQFDIRVDHQASKTVSLFTRYSFSDTNLFNPGPRPGLSEGSFNDTFGSALWNSQAIASGAVWTIAPNKVLDSRFGWTRGNFFQTPVNAGSGCPESLVGLKGSVTDEALCGGLPVFNVAGNVRRRIGRTTSVPQYQTPRSFDYRSALAWTVGSHTLKFGGELLHVQTGIRDISTLLGALNFTGRFTGQNNQYQGGIADLLLGFPTQYQQDSNTVFNVWQKLYFAYAQDDWRVTRKLTFNYGVRYEFATPPRERDNQWANFIPESRGFVQAKDGSLFDESLIHPDCNNVAPRFGFAYNVLGHTVVRAAYGIFYNHTNRQGREGLLGFNFPFIVQFDRNISGSNTLKSGAELFRLQNGIPPGLLDPGLVNVAKLSRKAQDPNQRTTYVQQWNFGIQQELPANMLLDVAYVGNRGLKLAAFRNYNQRSVSFNAQGVPVVGAQPLAQLGIEGDTVQLLENIATSNYHSLQTRVEKRFSYGVSALISYTWGKALTNAPDHLATSSGGDGVDVGVFKEPQNGNDRRSEYGPAEFDIAHRFVASGVWAIPYDATRPGAFLLSGWGVAPILSIQTGLPLTVIQSQVTNLGGERRSRPNRIGDGSLPEDQRTVDRYLDASAFVSLQPDPTRPGFTPNQVFGNSGVGILRGPGLVNLDVNLSKSFRITERQSVQFRAEFFNALNHTNLGVPGVNLSSGFGQIVSTATEARLVQFALKYRF